MVSLALSSTMGPGLKVDMSGMHGGGLKMRPEKQLLLDDIKGKINHSKGFVTDTL